MIDLKKLKAVKGYTYTIYEKPDVDGEFVKNLRKKLGFSQSMFALLMNVSNKTIEKWEQGKNPVSNGNAIAMILFDKDPDLVKIFIKREIPENCVDYKTLTFCSNTEVYINNERPNILARVSRKTQSVLCTPKLI